MNQSSGSAGDRLVGIREAVEALVRLLSAFGEEARSQWLEERLALLTHGTAADVTGTISDLHGVVLGMGGLMDLSLKGPSASASASANEELERLADRLYELTR